MRKSKVKNYTMNLTEGSIIKNLLLFSLPLMATNVLQLLFNAADIMVVGQFAGDHSLAAVGSTGSVIHLLTNIFMGLSVGVNVLAARFFAAGQEDNLRKTVHTAVLVSLVCGLLMVLIGEVAAGQVLRWMDSPEEVIDLAALYLRVYFLGMPATITYNFCAAVLRAVGDTKRPLYYLSFSGFLNLVLNCIFVIFLKMDVAGVALATVIAQYLAAFLVLRCLMGEEGPIRLAREYLAVDRTILGQMIRIGLPAGLQSSMFSLSNVVIQSSINSFGPTVIAGNSAATNIEGFMNVIMAAFSQGGVAFVSQHVGAGKYNRINKMVVTLQICVLTIGIVLGNLLYLCGTPLLYLYTDSAAVVTAGLKRLLYTTTVYCLFGMMDSMVSVLRGLGCSVMPMIVSLLGVCAFRVAWISILFTNEVYHTIETVYTAYPISWALTYIAHTVCFIVVRKRLKKRWGE